MMPSRVVANDRDSHRVKRLLNVLSAYLESYENNFKDGLVEVKNKTARSICYDMSKTFDRYDLSRKQRTLI